MNNIINNFRNKNKNLIRKSIVATFSLNILCLALLTSSGIANAQTYSIPAEQRDKYLTIDEHLSKGKTRNNGSKLFGGAEDVVIVEKNNSKKMPYYSDLQIRVLDEFLTKEDYVHFFEYFSSINVESNAPLKYLNSKIDDGHIPLFWLMSNEYASIKDSFNTHKWLYTALIMTTQDANLCNDRTSLVAPKTLLREFPNILNITTKTPQDIQPAVEDSARFIRNLKKRTNPKWTCTYGSNPVAADKQTVVDPYFWKEIRSDVIARFLQPYNIK